MKYFLINIFALVIYLKYAASQDSNASLNNETVIVHTKLGKILGITMQTWKGRDFYGFRGIRYGKPPIGELRFKAPKAVEKWHDTFDATTDGPKCPQPDQNNIDEDCLRLNVYTKQIPKRRKFQIKKPVILYIPEGNFYLGSGASDHLGGPQYLMEKDIVLVTINYRLGSLGFLSLGTEAAPGNAGLKDQVLAMKWVKEHIDEFGGNPDKITLLGNNAGAMSIILHMVSPMAQGLFHRAIAMSGGILVQTLLPDNQLYLAKRQADIFNCKTESPESILNCLKEIPATDFGTKLNEMFEYGIDNPIYLWLPVIEPDFGQERYLTEDPYILLRASRFERVPLLTGITKNEMIRSAVDIVNDKAILQQFDENYNDIYPICFQYDANNEFSKNITNELRNFYNLTTSPLTKDALTQINNLFGDAIIGFSVHRMVQIISKFIHVYYYQSSYQGRYSNTYSSDNQVLGVEHADDLLYLFVRNNDPYFSESDEEALAVERYTSLWTNFAKTGNPNNDNDNNINAVTWLHITHSSNYYLDIDVNLNVKRDLLSQRYSIWDQLYPL